MSTKTRTVEQTHTGAEVALGMPGDLSASNPAATTEAVLPYYQDDTAKTKYLSFRATGFTVGESTTLAGVVLRTVERWRASDSDFRRYDTAGIGELRRNYAATYLAAEFQRNLRSVMALDAKVIARANSLIDDGEDLGIMPAAEVNYLRAIRPMYSGTNLAAMIKATLTEADTGGQTINIDYKQLIFQANKAGDAIGE